MAVQAIQFLIHVQLLQPQHQLLLEAARLKLRGTGRLHQVGQACVHFLALACTDLWNQLAHLGSARSDSLDTLTDGCGQFFALAFAAGNKLVQQRVKQGQGMGLQRFGIHRLALQHAGVLQQVGEFGTQLREVRIQLQRDRCQLLDQHLIDLDRALAFRRTQAQREIQFAAGNAGGDAFAQHRLQYPQFLRQAQAQFEEAVVYRPQLAGQCAAIGGALGGGVGGHAADHGRNQCYGRRMVP